MIVVEVLDRGGRVAQRVQLAQLPATIGRGYANDVILDDPFADPAHARLVEGENGALVVEDLDSTNGLSAGEHAARERRLVLRPGATFRVGHTVLRVATTDTAVPPALRDTRLGGGSRARRAVHHWQAALALSVAGALLCGLAFYQGSTDQAGGGDFVVGVLSSVLFVSLWAGGWALATRLRSGRGRFLAHVAVAWLALGVIVAAGILESWVRFFTADAPLADAATAAALLAGITALLYGHLAVATSQSRGRRLAIGLIATVVVALLAVGLEQAGLSDEPGDIRVTMPLKPLAGRWIPAETPEAFLERAATLQQDVDREAEEKQ
jgi:hypothetical protein